MEEIETIAGFREWSVCSTMAGPRLVSTGNTIWEPGTEMIAVHRGEDPHEGKCPANHTRCGFNAFYRFRTLLLEVDGDFGTPLIPMFQIRFSPSFDPTRSVLGIISASGETVLSEYGFRSERCRLEALIAYKPYVKALGTKLDLTPSLKEIADAYGVPLLSPEEVEGFCWAEGLEILPDQEGESEIAPETENYAWATGYSIPQLYTLKAGGHTAHVFGSGLTITTSPVAPAPTRLGRFLKAMQVWRSTWPL